MYLENDSKSDPRDLWPLWHLIRVMRRHDNFWQATVDSDSLTQNVHYVAWSWCQVCLYKFTLQTTGRWKLLLHSRLFNDQNCSLQGLGCHRNDMTNAWPDDDSGQMLTSLKIPLASSIGAVLLLLLPLLVILHHVQQTDVSTNQSETGMTLLM